MNSESQLNFSCSHIATTDSMASRHESRLVAGSMPNAFCSWGIERPVPHSTRPRLNRSTVATVSAVWTGWRNLWGVSVTPKPRRIWSVICDSAARNAPFAGMCDRSMRKWCSTTQTVPNPSLSASLICSIASK